MVSQPSLCGLSVVCAEVVQLAHSCPSGGLSLNIGVHLRGSWEGLSSVSAYAITLYLPPTEMFFIVPRDVEFLTKTFLIVRGFKGIFKLLACIIYVPHFYVTVDFNEQ